MSYHRPLLQARHEMVVAGHYLAAAAGFRILQMGGNAIDAAAAAGFCLGVVEPQENTLGGEVPILVYSARDRRSYAISGVGWSPERLTIDWCRSQGIDLIPGDGFLPACVPAVVGTWGLALQRFGTLPLSRVLEPAMDLASGGFPLYPGLRGCLEANRVRFLDRYPTTADVYLPGGKIPALGERVRNPDVARLFECLCEAEEGASHKGREAGIQAAVDCFYRGAIAEGIVAYASDTDLEDASGAAHRGLLSLGDFAEWEARIEQPVALEFRGLRVEKCPSWTQGPVFLQQLALLAHFDLEAMGQNSAAYLHTLIECAKLAFADREAWYGDPAFDDVPVEALLSPDYNRARAWRVGHEASLAMRPGQPEGRVAAWDIADVRADNRRALGLAGGEARTGSHGHDTTHLDVIDRHGNMVSATPSGGWLPSSPVLPGLGFPLGTRGQMFYLNASRPNALAGRKRPRATLTPTLVTRDGEPWAVFGMRGGDIQDQISLQFFLNHAVFGMDVQRALDSTACASEHFPNSFYPREANEGRVLLDQALGGGIARDLESRGHEVVPWSPGHKLMAIRRHAETGLLSGGVCSSAEQAWGMGW